MQHKPKITTPKNSRQGEWEYRDGDVFAIISSDLKSYCEIQEFSSSQPRKGNGRAAIEWMKNKYQNIHVNDPGNEIDAPDAFLFWCKLAEENLIQSMTDGDSTPIFEDGEWVIDNVHPDDYPELYRRLTENAPALT